MNSREQQDARQSMWSVNPAFVPLYFALFTLGVIVGTAFIVWYEVGHVTSDSAPDTMVGIIQGVGWVGLASAIGTITLIETLEYAMVMANWFRQNYLEPLKERQRNEGLELGLKEGREQGLEQGREEALTQVKAEIREWDRRRREAEARGERFDDPPPYSH